MMQYQYVWHKTGSSVFNLEILMSKMYLAGRPITGKVDEIMEKVKQDRYITSYDIGKEAIHHKTVLKHLKKAG